MTPSPRGEPAGRGTFAPGGLWFGGDYNPEQWGPRTWAEDDILMRRARVDTATVGVFAWSVLEPDEGRYRFGWLDDTLDRLHRNGIRVVLATPTASPPPWFSAAHPDALPVTADGRRLTHGSRDTYCAAAPAYREAALRIARALGDRYAGHPALAMWHVHNEYGTLCHCEHAADAFRTWLRRRHADDLSALNQAWNTPFWSQVYATWEQILPPRSTQYLPNPGQVLDFARFWSDELLDAYREQRDALRAPNPAVPVTTNFILPDYQNVDLWAWSREVDVVAVDHYPNATGVEGRIDLAFGADRARSFNDGRPWLLMEQAPGVVHLHEQGVMRAKPPGGTLADSLGYVARGSDAVLFFQWRAGRGGAERHHPAMLPHAGPDTRIHREIVGLGDVLQRLAELTGSTVRARVALLWDADAWWAMEAPGLPSSRLRYLPLLRRAHAALWRAGVTADFAHPEADLSGYRAVLAPASYLLTDAGAANLRRYVARGGHLLLGPFGAVADGHGAVRQGGFPGLLRDVAGLRVEEFHPLATGERVTLSSGAVVRDWAERVDVEGAEVLATHADGDLAGDPAITRHGHGTGTLWYVSVRLDDAGLDALVGDLLAFAGVGAELPGAPPGVEAVRRHHADGRSWLFVTNHTQAPQEITAAGVDLVSGAVAHGTLTLAPGQVAVLRETGPGCASSGVESTLKHVFSVLSTPEDVRSAVRSGAGR